MGEGGGLRVLVGRLVVSVLVMIMLLCLNHDLESGQITVRYGT